MQFLGEHTRKSYRMGDTVWVQVARANTELRNIDFTFVDKEFFEENVEYNKQ